MFDRNLCAANSVAFKTSLVNQSTCKISGRAFKHTACTGKLQRLFANTALAKLCHLSKNCTNFAFRHGNSYRSNNQTATLKRSFTISKAHIFIGQHFYIAISVHSTNSSNYIRHLSVVSTCVHIHSAANGTGNTYCKLHTGKTKLCRFLRSKCKGHATTKSNGIFTNFDSIKHIAKLNYQTANTFVANKQVRTVTNQGYRNIMLFSTRQ